VIPRKLFTEIKNYMPMGNIEEIAERNANIRSAVRMRGNDIPQESLHGG